jgi:hypothetical protein
MPWVKHRSSIDLSRVRAAARHPAAPFAVAISLGIVLAVAVAIVLKPRLDSKPPTEPMAAVLMSAAALPEPDVLRIRRRFSEPDEVAFGAAHLSPQGGVCGWVWDPKGSWHRFITFDNLAILDLDETPELFERRWEARC